MADFARTLTALRRERSRAAMQVGRIDEAIAVIGKLVGQNGLGLKVRKTSVRKRTMSAASRRKIAAAQRARWAKWKAKQAKKAAQELYEA